MRNKVTYFFLDGRIDRLNSDNPFPEEMFYGYKYLKNNYKTVKIIEAKKSKARLFFQNIIEDKISYIVQVPLFFTYFFSLKNIYLFTTSKHVFLTNHRVAASSLPLIFISKILFLKPKLSIFVMGLFRENPSRAYLYKFKFKIIKFLFKNSEYIYFLGKEEFETSLRAFPEFSNKFIYYPFSVDLNFWHKENVTKKDQILFVGNDGRRDYDFLYKLVESQKNQKFIVLSNQVNPDKLNYPNCQIISGSFTDQGISDMELRDLYRESWITILPLKDSIQPSGQSVALQSLACGTPVVITDTIGFWDRKSFINEKNIFFVKNNNVKEWNETLNNIPPSKDQLYKRIIDNADTLLREHYNLDMFHEELADTIQKLS